MAYNMAYNIVDNMNGKIINGKICNKIKRNFFNYFIYFV